MKLLRLPEVSARTGRSRTRIYADIEAGLFPRPVKLGAGGAGAIGFVEAEIDAWIKAKVEARDAEVA